MSSAGFRCLSPLLRCAAHGALGMDDRHQLLSKVKQHLSATLDVLQ